MLTRQKAQSMAMRLIPHKGVAVVTLNPGVGQTAVTCPNAWVKQKHGGLKQYGGPFVEQDKTIVKIFDTELNPAGNGRKIREGDKITFGGVNYIVTADGGNLVSNRTVWDCNVQKEFA